MLTRSAASKTPHLTPVRRSARLLSPKTPIKSKDFSTPEAKSKESHARTAVKTSKESVKSSKGSTNCVDSASELLISPRLNSTPSEVSTKYVKSTSGLRKSPRLNKPEGSKFVETKKVESGKKTVEGGLLGEEKKGVKRKEIIIALKAVTVEERQSERSEARERNEDVGVKEKRKRRPDVGVDEVSQGWTREQELALQRAYFSAKPTPHFWKKVSKLVPGKSAQDCFDKIHSDHLTPTQPRPRSRAKEINLSPIGHFSLSASKLLKPTAPQNKKSGCIKQKSCLVQKKTVRHLLRKHYHVYQGEEVDLFSILEPNTSPSTHALPNAMLSTPKILSEIHKCQERSSESSGLKKSKSRLGNACTGSLVSPPVLKQIRNRALHEKYIDQLHSREAKREAESERTKKELLGKENRGSTQIQKIDKVRAAKNALVSDARNVINQLQQLQTTNVDNSLDLDNDDYIDDEDEDEIEL